MSGANAASGPPALPLVIAATASACCVDAPASTMTPTIQLPAAMTACDSATTTNVTPARSRLPNRPWSMRYVIANRQKPSVAGAVALLVTHGHTNRQLHASRYSPAIAHVVMHGLYRPGAAVARSVRCLPRPAHTAK